jgi:MFS family permease
VNGWIFHIKNNYKCRNKKILGLFCTLIICVSVCVAGFSFGIGLTYPLCGFLIAHFGWRVVFYVTGSVGILWCLMWWLLAFDTPAQHPRITASERRYIEANVGNTVVGEKVGKCLVPNRLCLLDRLFSKSRWTRECKLQTHHLCK